MCCVNDLALSDASRWQHESIASVAREYAGIVWAHLRAVGRSRAPIALAGWSYGGVVAIEVARQLQSAKRALRVASLVLMDSPVTLTRPLLTEEEFQRVVDQDVAQVLSRCVVLRLFRPTPMLLCAHPCCNGRVRLKLGFKYTVTQVRSILSARYAAAAPGRKLSDIHLSTIEAR